MKSSLFQFYFLDIRSIRATEGIDGEKKIWKNSTVCGTIVAYRCRIYTVAKRKKITRVPKSKKQERSFLCKYHDMG